MTVGVYRFRRRRIAFRNDYCMSCRRSVRAWHVRSFLFLSIQFIPLLPLGFWKHWECAICATNPASPATARTSILTLGAVVFGLFGLLAVFVGLTAPGVETGPVLAFGVGFLTLSGGLFYWCWRRWQAPSYREQFDAVPPADDIICPWCNAKLTEDPATDRLVCEDCGLTRE